MSDARHSTTDAQLALLIHKMDELAKSQARTEERITSLDGSIRGDGTPTKPGLASRMDAAERDISEARETAVELKRGFIRTFYAMVTSLLIAGGALAWKYLTSGGKPPTH